MIPPTLLGVLHMLARRHSSVMAKQCPSTCCCTVGNSAVHSGWAETDSWHSYMLGRKHMRYGCMISMHADFSCALTLLPSPGVRLKCLHAAASQAYLGLLCPCCFLYCATWRWCHTHCQWSASCSTGWGVQLHLLALLHQLQHNKTDSTAQWCDLHHTAAVTAVSTAHGWPAGHCRCSQNDHIQQALSCDLAAQVYNCSHASPECCSGMLAVEPARSCRRRPSVQLTGRSCCFLHPTSTLPAQP